MSPTCLSTIINRHSEPKHDEMLNQLLIISITNSPPHSPSTSTTNHQQDLTWCITHPCHPWSTSLPWTPNGCKRCYAFDAVRHVVLWSCDAVLQLVAQQLITRSGVVLVDVYYQQLGIGQDPMTKIHQFFVLKTGRILNQYLFCDRGISFSWTLRIFGELQSEVLTCGSCEARVGTATAKQTRKSPLLVGKLFGFRPPQKKSQKQLSLHSSTQ